MDKFVNFKVVYKDDKWELRVTFFRGRTFREILPYFEKFKEELKDIILIEKPINDEYLYSWETFYSQTDTEWLY